MEAAGNGYYNPANPHNVYTPALYPSAPPSYDDVTKKNQWLLFKSPACLDLTFFIQSTDKFLNKNKSRQVTMTLYIM